ncbi:MAG: glycosyltransferase family 9 protein, partial [Dehalococcoidia bacterium]
MDEHAIADGHQWSEARNMLCVRLDGAGDLLMTTPAIRALKESAPDRHITLLTSHSGAEVAALVPEIDEVLVYESPWMKTANPRTSGPDYAVLERVRRRHFDAAVIFTVYSQSPLPAALFCYLADIPLRLAHCRENPYLLLSDWVPEQEPERLSRHEVQRQLDLVATVGCATQNEKLGIRVSEAAYEKALTALQGAGVDPERPWIAVHPGATAPSRRYPPELFGAAANVLSADDGCQLVFTGSKHERSLVNEIQQSMEGPSVSLAGTLDLQELSALVSLAPVLVSNNTLPVHIAAAVGTPVVDLYALTNP